MQYTQVYNPPVQATFLFEVTPINLGNAGCRTMEVDNVSNLELTVVGDGAPIGVITPYNVRVLLNTGGSWGNVRVTATGTVQANDVVRITAFDTIQVPGGAPVQSFASVNPQYYDRNPSNMTNWYDLTNLAPHAVTVRISYTVPSNRKAFIDQISLFIKRETAAGVVDQAGGDANYITAGGLANNGLSFDLITSNNVADHDRQINTQFGAMLSGDQLNIDDYDFSTGGTTEAAGGFKVFEFDAS